eukprot:TRINITY_DN78820_c0_g1_i1.p2 TRINITY_DN78820_c0_g1~~TRINITY_DN78820_c0_g1_i1.p2  ORF type:complete len:222 (-),score=1.24 TRINITY_DN78820_c0_g1_i1:140-805(-)
MATGSVPIAQLLAANPYNPEILPDLEKHVDEQIASRTYDLDANLTLLRLYMFEPARVNVSKISRILTKAMMALPRTDVTLCLCLIPERYQIEEPLSTLISLAHFLETARFREFWAEVAQQKDLLGGVPGFEEAIQTYALHVLSISHRRVPREILAEAININGPSLDDFIQRHVETSGWMVVPGKTGQVVELPNNIEAQAASRGYSESIPLDHVSRLFPILS